MKEKPMRVDKAGMHQDQLLLFRTLGQLMREAEKQEPAMNAFSDSEVGASVALQLALTRNATLRTIYTGTGSSYGWDTAASIGKLMWEGWQWTKWGRNCFDLTEDMASALTLTEMPDVTVSDIALPYPNFVVRLLGRSPFTVIDREGRELPVRYIHVNTCSAIIINETTKRVREEFNQVIVPLMNKYEASKDEKWRTEMVAGMVKLSHELPTTRMLSIYLRPKGDGPQLYHRAQFEPETKLRDLVDNAGGPQDDKYMPEGVEPFESERTETECVVQRVAAEMLINFLLYISTHPPKTKTKKKRKASKRGPAPITIHRVPTVSLPSNLHTEAFAYAHRGRRPAGWKVHASTMVRGHFRRQPHGPGKTLRKTIYIEPHRRGPEPAEALEKVYKVKAKGADNGGPRSSKRQATEM